MVVLLFIVMVFAGYAVGRISHILGGHLNVPHHWIYGVLLIIVGAIFYQHTLGWLALAFGIGHTISDLDDMMALKFYGRDEPGPKHFWGTD